MKVNRYIQKPIFRSSGGTLLTDYYSGTFLNDIKRSALLAGLLGAVVLATGCSSTPHNFSARLITPNVTNGRHIDARDDGFYQPARSPAFSEDLGG
jgi:hypothetical protein